MSTACWILCYRLLTRIILWVRVFVIQPIPRDPQSITCFFVRPVLISNVHNQWRLHELHCQEILTDLFYGRHLSDDILTYTFSWNLLYILMHILHSVVNEVCSQMQNWQLVSTGSGDSLVRNSRQAISITDSDAYNSYRPIPALWLRCFK